MTNDALKCKQEFEKHITNTGLASYLKQDSNGEYVYLETQKYWEEWFFKWHAALAPVDICERCKGTGKWGWSEAPDLYDCQDCKPKSALAPVDVDLMASIYEEERAKYVGGKVYYPHNQAAFMGCMNKALAARGCFGVPDGYVLVPIEPTEDMCKAAEESEFGSGTNDCTEEELAIFYDVWVPENVEELYKAMIKAAPKKEGV